MLPRHLYFGEKKSGKSAPPIPIPISIYPSPLVVYSSRELLLSSGLGAYSYSHLLCLLGAQLAASPLARRCPCACAWRLSCSCAPAAAPTRARVARVACVWPWRVLCACACVRVGVGVCVCSWSPCALPAGELLPLSMLSGCYASPTGMRMIARADWGRYGGAPRWSMVVSKQYRE